MKKSIAKLTLLLVLLSHFASANADTKEYSVNISNKDLIPMLLELDGRTEISKSKIEQIKNTEVLIPVSATEDVSEPNENGIVTINQERNIKLISLNNAGVSLLPIFTSWKELKTFFDYPISAVVLPVGNAANLFLDGDYNYMVVDNASHAINLNVATLRKVAKQR
ncbi:hypothetical protein MACH09_36720 [Vibrio sp. MACH09]|uniref:SseB family protein n=1 Tax=Vibrio sp. MACH09 TaxID=3025122 RepID=UPI0027924FF9|nr:SseB family protein [Vibrio sp. MACH09]GLO63164.1 hypothetical protein MACH09_36720 [Vibrio sp. MACH09]